LDPLPENGKPNYSKQPELNFEEMIKFPFVEKHMFGNISCSDDQFGNVARDTTKQCFCASEMPT
jgi:S-adenosylmethionine hydrolase